MNIVGKKVFLRAMEPEDMEMLREMINDPDMERMVGGWSFPISKVEQTRWYERAVGDKNNLRFIIETLDTHEAIGMVNLVNIDWKNRTGHHGIKLRASAAKGKGYGTDAVMSLMWYAFEQLQFNRLDSACIAYNMASQKLYEKCGWTVEGIRRRAIYKDGKFFDQQYTGILREEYFEAKKRLQWDIN